MKEFLTQLTNGIKIGDIDKAYKEIFEKLVDRKAVKIDDDIAKLDSKYRVGQIDISSKGIGYLDSFGVDRGRDLIIDEVNFNGALKGDIVLAKRVFSKRGAKAKVVLVLKRSSKVSVVYIDKIDSQYVAKDIKSDLSFTLPLSQQKLKSIGKGAVLKVDNESLQILEVLGEIEDPKVDEKISLALYDKSEFFPKEAEEEANSFGDSVDKRKYKDRVDLTHLPFCTIDPPDAKDFDDAIYFDIKNDTLYVAIADVSEYVKEGSALDEEAKKRGFSIYLPHKSIPMLPRALSENICSLKPNEDRLAFVCKMELDSKNFKVLNESFINGVIHSKRRFTYDEIDSFIEGDLSAKREDDDEILDYLMPLKKVLDGFRRERLKSGCEFHSKEVRMILDENQNLIKTRVEIETPSHALIEDAMLLANKAAAKRFEKGIFRVHERPDYEKIEKVLDELEKIGVESEMDEDLYKSIQNLQKIADERGIRAEVDRLLIQAQQQACYSIDRELGHFGLGFDLYTHFTSPIRRYSDLIVHRLLKALLSNHKKLIEYISANIEVWALRVSELERESVKVEWDYMDRKYARWAREHKGEHFKAIVADVSSSVPVAFLDDEIYGARLFLMSDDELELFDRVVVEIVEVNIPQAKIIAKVVERERLDV